MLPKCENDNYNICLSYTKIDKFSDMFSVIGMNYKEI